MKDPRFKFYSGQAVLLALDYQSYRRSIIDEKLVDVPPDSVEYATTSMVVASLLNDELSGLTVGCPELFQLFRMGAGASFTLSEDGGGHSPAPIRRSTLEANARDGVGRGR